MRDFGHPDPRCFCISDDGFYRTVVLTKTEKKEQIWCPLCYNDRDLLDLQLLIAENVSPRGYPKTVEKPLNVIPFGQWFPLLHFFYQC